MTFQRQMVEGPQQPATLKRRSRAVAGAPEVSLPDWFVIVVVPVVDRDRGDRLCSL